MRRTVLRGAAGTRATLRCGMPSLRLPGSRGSRSIGGHRARAAYLSHPAGLLYRVEAKRNPSEAALRPTGSAPRLSLAPVSDAALRERDRRGQTPFTRTRSTHKQRSHAHACPRTPFTRARRTLTTSHAHACARHARTREGARKRCRKTATFSRPCAGLKFRGMWWTKRWITGGKTFDIPPAEWQMAVLLVVFSTPSCA